MLIRSINRLKNDIERNVRLINTECINDKETINWNDPERTESKMGRSLETKMLLCVVALITTLSLSACGETEIDQPEERALSVEIMEVAYGNVEVRTTLTGLVEPRADVRLTPKMPGIAKQVYVSIGEQVVAGQVLVTLDQNDIQNSIRQSEAGLAIAQAGLETAEAGLAMAEEQHAQSLRELERIKVLYDQGAVTKQQFEQAEMAASEASLNSTRSQVNQARAQVNQARVAAENARSVLTDTEIRTPIAGIVTEINAKVGEVVSGQMAAVSVAQLDPVVVKPRVSEYLINRFSINQEVAISIPAASNEPYQGMVNAIAPVPAAGTMTYPMEIEIGNQDGLIKAGMFAEINLTTETRRNVLVVPSEAVVIREGRTVLFLVEGHRAVMREVIVGIDNGQSAEIVYGVNAGHRIIFRGQDFLEDGSLIDDVEEPGSDAS
jgi:RND family efflux transporter MFP subunit